MSLEKITAFMLTAGAHNGLPWSSDELLTLARKSCGTGYKHMVFPVYLSEISVLHDEKCKIGHEVKKWHTGTKVSI